MLPALLITWALLGPATAGGGHIAYGLGGYGHHGGHLPLVGVGHSYGGHDGYNKGYGGTYASHGGGQHHGKHSYGGQGVYGSKQGVSAGGHNYGTLGKKKQGFSDYGGQEAGVHGQTGYGGRGHDGARLGNVFVKDRGHKRYGSKNVQHKEEFDDHQSYHDVYRDKDYKKKYADYDKKFKNSGGKKFKTLSGGDYFKGGHFGDKYGKHGLSNYKDTYGTHYKKGGKQHGGGEGHAYRGSNFKKAYGGGGGYAHYPVKGGHY